MAYVIIDATVARLERGGGRLQEKTKEKIEGQSVSYEDSNRIHRDIHQFIIILSLYALSNKKYSRGILSETCDFGVAVKMLNNSLFYKNHAKSHIYMRKEGH